MKRLILYILLSTLTVTVFAQSPTTSFDVAGIKVILKPTVKEIISVRMFYRGGVNNYSAANAGIEDMALVAATECGTKKYNKNAFKDLQDQYGIEIGGSSVYDFGTISMNCISKYFNQGWDLFAESIVNPTFDPKELDQVKTKMISDIKQQESDPEDYIENEAIKSAFKDTPYAIDPSGDETTLSKFTSADIKKYYTGILNKNQMFLVVVGKISKEDLIKKITASFAAIPSKPYTPKTYNVPAFTGSSVITKERSVATNYIVGLVNAPKMSSEDYVAYRLAISVLSSNLFREIRTKRNLSYAPGAHQTSGQIPYAIVSVSTTEPKASVEVMVNELKELQEETVSDEGLQQLKGSFITNNYMKEQSSAAMAVGLGQAEIMGSWKIVEELPNKINAATAEQIRDAAKKYISGIKWSYLGDLKSAGDAAAAFNSSVD
jgi:zinc protease